MNNKLKRLYELFSTTFLISASTSGGYAIVSVMKTKFVDKYKWISEDEMIDLLAIAQSTPGPIAINTSVLVGYRVCGFVGAIVTLLGTTLPPLIIMSIVANFYEQFKDITIIRYLMKGMAAAVAALLVSVTVDLFTNLKKNHSVLSYILLIISFLLVRFTKINILYVVLMCATCGVIKVFNMKEDK